MDALLNTHNVTPEERFVLHKVSWETYEQLLKNYGDCSVPRLTYDQGDLEIMSPPLPHEAASEILKLLVNVICEERNLDVIGLGSTTHKRGDLLKGVEPDGCFYIQHAAAMRGIDNLDLKQHPPADLATEVDLSRSSVPKLPIYAALGISEVWQFEDGQLRIHCLKGGGYVALPESCVLPRISSASLTRFINEAIEMKRPEWLRSVREWIRRSLGTV